MRNSYGSVLEAIDLKDDGINQAFLDGNSDKTNIIGCEKYAAGDFPNSRDNS